MSQALAPQILTKFYDLFTMVLGLEATPRDVLKSIHHVTEGNNPLQQALQNTCNAAMLREPTQLPQISEDLAQQALHLYGHVATHVFAQTSPTALENLSPKTLHHFSQAVQIASQNPLYARKLVEFLTHAEPGADVLQYHSLCLKNLFKYASRSSYMQGAIKRILTYQGGKIEPQRRFYNDLSYIQAKIASHLRIPRAVTAIDKRPSNLSGSAKIQYDDKSTVFMPVVYLHPLSKRGVYRTGEHLLLVSCHELGHIFEIVHIDQWSKALASDASANVLPQGILRFAQNSDALGMYVSSAMNYELYDTQLRERHADWFAAECIKTLKSALIRRTAPAYSRLTT